MFHYFHVPLPRCVVHNVTASRTMVCVAPPPPFAHHRPRGGPVRLIFTRRRLEVGGMSLACEIIPRSPRRRRPSAGSRSRCPLPAKQSTVSMRCCVCCIWCSTRATRPPPDPIWMSPWWLSELSHWDWLGGFANIDDVGEVPVRPNRLNR